MVFQSTNHLRKCLLIIYITSTIFIIFMVFLLESSSHWNFGNVGQEVEKDGLNKLLDLDDFKFVINSDICRNVTNPGKVVPVKSILIITSYAGDFEMRTMIRKMFRQRILYKLGIRRIFMLGMISETKNINHVSQHTIIEESNRFRDILQGNFIEDYRNLTYKHTMGLMWVSSYCTSAKYVLKMDHDILVNFYELNRVFQKLPKIKNFLAGYVLLNMKPIREPSNKWYVTEKEYSGIKYPNFLSGWFYITTPYVAKILYESSQKVPYFWIDDLYITGILAEFSSIKLTMINEYYAEHSEYLECCVSEFNSTCDFLIGPSSGNKKLIEQFALQSEYCYYYGCRYENSVKSLKERCVVKIENDLFGKGEPVVSEVPV